MAVFAKFYLR